MGCKLLYKQSLFTKTLVIFLLIASLILSYNMNCYVNKVKLLDPIQETIQQKTTKNRRSIQLQTYMPHDPIFIRNNSYLIYQASQEGWIGNGTISNPYIIEGLNITGSDGPLIHIEQVTLHFVISGCYLKGGQTGIYLFFVENATISNHNHILDNEQHGIHLSTCDGSTIDGNAISSSNASGIFLEYSNNINITRNSISSNGLYGINTIGWMYYGGIVGNVTIAENELIGNYVGIRVYMQDKVTIQDNMITNGGTGISVSNSGWYNEGGEISIHDNLITYNSYGGRISISGMTHFRNNTFSHNTLALELGPGFLENSVSLNNFIMNGNGQVADNDLYYSWNVAWNYWNDLLIPDENSDGIVDIHYSLAGTSNNTDPYPLTSKVLNSFPHLLSQPVLIAPENGETFINSVEISWQESRDSFGHNVSYSIFYSSDNGVSWTLVVSNLTQLVYTWDTGEIEAPHEYLVKIVASCTDDQTRDSYHRSITIVQETTTTASSIQTNPPTTNPGSLSQGVPVGWYLFPLIMLALTFLVHQKRKKKR